jgi:hypothetical protein
LASKYRRWPRFSIDRRLPGIDLSIDSDPASVKAFELDLRSSGEGRQRRGNTAT